MTIYEHLVKFTHIAVFVSLFLNLRSWLEPGYFLYQHLCTRYVICSEIHKIVISRHTVVCRAAQEAGA